MKTKFRRRRQGITDYLRRKNLLKSGKPRVVFRKTNKYIIAQYVTSKEAKDKVEITANSKELLNYGWPKENSGSLKSITASYLTGFLIGTRIISEKKETPILDMGMITPVHKTKPFAFLRGLMDAGVKIAAEDEILPEEERIKGKHLKKDLSEMIEKIKSNIKGGK